MAPVPTHMHPTDIWPLITKYKHHGSQANYGAPFILVHSDVCGPFSTPTSASHCYYILQFIDDYTCYTIVWVLPDKKSKTCTSAYHTDIREGERLEIYTGTITIACSPPYLQAYSLSRSTLKYTHLRTYKHTLPNLPIGTYKYTYLY